jgi:hypothetical protein
LGAEKGLPTAVGETSFVRHGCVPVLELANTGHQGCDGSRRAARRSSLEQWDVRFVFERGCQGRFVIYLCVRLGRLTRYLEMGCQSKL